MSKVNQALSIIDLFESESPEATEFRRLLHNLNGAYVSQVARQRGEKSPDFSELTKGLKKLLVTSAVGSEGKTTVAAFLAISAARFKEKRTLLIDVDLRRPTIHKLFATERTTGLAETLTEGLSPSSAIKRTELDRLDLVTAGRALENPADVFDAKRVNSIVEEMSREYDFVVLDTSPVLPVSDPLLLSEFVDGVLFVIKAGDTSRDVVSRSWTLLSGSGAPLLGVVLNNLNASLPSYYDSGYYEYEPDPS